MPISVNGEGSLPINILDGNGTIELNLTSNDTLPTIEPRTFTIDGNAYTFYITSSKSSNADIASARQGVENPTHGVVVYLHYYLDEAVMGYKVEFAPDHFGELSDEEREEARFTFKQGIANLVEAYQMAQEVEDWSVVVSESVQKLNGRLKDAVGEMAIPEEIWDQQTYPNEPEYLESFSTGLADGVLEEVANIPLLLSLVVDYTTDAGTRERINTAIANIDVEEIIENFVQGREDLYTGGNPYRIKHQTGKDVIAAGTLLGTGGAASLGKLKKGVEFVEGLAEQVRKNASGAVKVFSKQIDEVVDRLKKNANYILEGTGEYRVVKGHHPTAKKAFEGDITYDFQKAFSVSVDALKDSWKAGNSGIPPTNIHSLITGQQNSLYSAWKKANPNAKLTINIMADIEIQV